MNNNEVKNQQGQSVPLAIVGVGCMFPDAKDTGTFWTNIKTGKDSIREVPSSHWNSEDYFNQDPKAADRVYAKMGGFLSPVEFNPMDYGILPNALEAIDTSQLLSLLTVEQALKDSGYLAEREFDRDRVSVILGVTGALELVIPLGARLGHPRWKEALADAGVPAEVAEDVLQRISDSYVPWQENSFPGLLGNVVAGRISKHFNLGGTNCVVDAACGSSLSALNLAALELAAGRTDMVITGGVDTFNDIFMYTCFSKTPALSPSGHARPYSADSDGTTLGEGLGVVVLKRLADAEQAGDKIYAVIKGVGASSDGKGSAIYEPDAKGQAKALRRAYEQAGIEPQTVGLIEGHGTGTRVGDAIEVSAIQEVFGPAEKPWCALGSVKSQIGHTKAAAGSAGLIKAALALYHKILPPTIKVSEPHESLLGETSPLYVNTECRPWPAADHPRRAGISALGFGGSNFHCLLEEHLSEKQVIDWNGDVQVLPFSGPDIASLKAAVQAFPASSSWHEVRIAADNLRQGFDRLGAKRLVVIIDSSMPDVSGHLQNVVKLLERNQDKEQWDMPDGTCFSGQPLNGEVAVLFPGQGAQYPGMLKDLALTFPKFFAVLNAADRCFSGAGEEHGVLAQILYPRPAFSEQAALNASAALQQTENAQPALGTVSLGALKVLQDMGLTADAYAGHSYGELTALCAAGVISNEDLFKLSKLRGQLMAAGDGDRGSMLAVSAPLAEIEDLLKTENLNLVLANRNTPGQGVLSGATAEIKKAGELLKSRNITCKQLTVSAAFHSSLVADAASPFAAEIQQTPFAEPQAKVFSNTSGEVYPDSPEAMVDLLSRQLPSPVDFVKEIHSMYAAGARYFVEIGPGARLTGMVKAILDGETFDAVALDSSNGKRSAIQDLARLLAKLAALGIKLELGNWDAGYAARFATEGKKKPGLVVELCGANYFKKPAKRPARPQQAVVAPAMKDVPKPVAAQTSPPKAPVPVAPVAKSAISNASLQDALRMTTESMQALQSLQDQTAKLHQQFLAGQQSATQSFMQLIQQQQALLQGNAPVNSAAAPVVNAAVPATAPAVPQGAPASVVAAPRVIAVESQPPVPSVSVAPVFPPAISVAPQLLAIIAEKTGYPVEMLELDMALDSDLGIDSIKRVEILSALQENLPQAPVIKPEDLGRLQTLGQIVQHIEQEMPAEGTVAVAPAGAGSSVDRAAISATLLGVIADKTGYPVDMLELGMALDSDLGIDSIKRVEILSALQEQMPELPAVKPEDLGVLQTLGQIVDHLCANAPVATAAPSNSSVGPDPGVVASTLLGVIAEKTGYPAEMLELEMALDSDLGIDSIKRVEILSALQEKMPDLPAVKPEDLGVLQTLGQIVDHLCAGLIVTSAGAASAVAVVDKAMVTNTLLNIIADKTGYPVEMLELGMALDTDLGIDSIKRVEILSALQEKLPELPTVKPEDLAVLQTLGQIVEHLCAGQITNTQTQMNGGSKHLSREQVTATLLSVIADKTGYPVEMLELGMALDTDLGIDSIKRVEILSALQEQMPELPAVKPEDLGVLQTLGQIVDHLCAGKQETVSPEAPQMGIVPRDQVAQTLLSVIADKTGYPVEMLELEMALDTDLGIDSIKRVEILSALQEQLPGVPAIKPEHLGTLQTVAQIVDFLSSVSGNEQPAEQVSEHAAATGKGIKRQFLTAVTLPKGREKKDFQFAPGSQIWITDDGSALSDAICQQLTAHQLIPRKVNLEQLEELEVPAYLSGLVLLAPLKGTTDVFLKNSFCLLQKSLPALDAAAGQGGAVLTTVSRINGTFGVETGRQIGDSLSGGLAGLCKTAALEWPSLHCKALDIAVGMEIQSTAESIAQEMFSSGPVEVGVTTQGLKTLELVTEALDSVESSVPVNEDDLVVISGGARGVTAEVAVALARETKATLLLLGRSQLPGDEPAWLASLSDEAAIKKGIIAHADHPLKPKDIATAYQRICAEREIRSTLDRILRAGGTPVYRSVDLRNSTACKLAIDEVVGQYGPVRGLVHGAGVLADKLILEKTTEQFDYVYDTKITGLRHLFENIDRQQLKFMALFSSSTGRFGRIGQVDYAVANEVLNKFAASAAEELKDCRIVSLNWGPWDGGMVTPELKKVFAREGIDVIDLEAGANYLVRELSTASGPVELVISGCDENEQESHEKSDSQANLYVSKAFDLDLSIDQFPFLKSHVIDGKAVLPMAVIVEWLAHGAIHNNPGLRFQGFNDLRVLKGVILDAERTYTIQVMTGKAIKSDGVHVIPVEISGVLADGRSVPHARARIQLAQGLPAQQTPMAQPDLAAYRHSSEDIYNINQLFHGRDFQGIKQVNGCSAQGISILAAAAPRPAEWIEQPLRSSWFADPLILDSSFQSLILWSFDQYQAGSLPVFAARYRQYREQFPVHGVEIRVKVTEQTSHGAHACIDFVDPEDGTLVARMDNYECVIDSSLNKTFQRNKLTGVA